MSGLFNQASLVLVPSGYKSGKVYSEVPTNGDGDLTFTRASSATRVNSDGLIESPRTNLVLYSEQFDNSYWQKAAVTLTANTINAPNGTLTADQINESVANSTHGVYPYLGTSIVVGTSYTASMYVKKGNRSYCGLQAFFNSSNGAIAFFNLDNGTLLYQFAQGSGYSITNSSITNVGNDWYLLKSTFTFGSTTAYVGVCMASTQWTTGTSYNNTYVGDTSKFMYIWGAQLEQGSTATEYIPTTASARTTFAGITQDGTSASNVPRLDYSQGSCPSLLLEPQRTNTILRSQDLSNASWTKTNVTITQNAITSPIESFNSDAIVENSGTNTVFGFHAASRPSGLTIGTTYSVSFFAKKITRDWCYFNDFNAFQTPQVLVFFNLATGTVGTSPSGVLNPKMENYGNGWYRCSFQFVASSTLIDYRIASATSDNTVSYSGTIGQESISVTACQFEAGTYATSYIPTTSATVTRLTDDVSLTSAAVSTIAPTSGVTMFIDLYLSQNQRSSRFAVFDNDYSNHIFLGSEDKALDQSLRFDVQGGGVTFLSYAPSFTSVGRHKMAVKFLTSGIKVYLDGVEVASSGANAGFSASFQKIILGRDYPLSAGAFSRSMTNSIMIFPTALSDIQLAELTTL